MIMVISLFCKIYLFGCIMYPARLLTEKCYILQICIRYIKMLVVDMGMQHVKYYYKNGVGESRSLREEKSDINIIQ